MSKILVADDESMVRQLCYDLFSKEGHQVITVGRGDQVLEMIRTQKPDLVLLDISIPGEQGLSLLERMNREAGKKMAVVIFSGAVTPELEKQAMTLGAIDVIHKGLGIHELRDKVNKILAAKHLVFGEPRDRSKDKILVVDDDDAVRGLLVTFLHKKGIRVIEANSGELALMLVEKERPNMILLDVTMPGMDGILTLKKIREIDPEVGIVMASAVQDEQIAREATELGAYAYVLKPFDLQYLEMVVWNRLLIAV